MSQQITKASYTCTICGNIQNGKRVKIAKSYKLNSCKFTSSETYCFSYRIKNSVLTLDQRHCKWLWKINYAHIRQLMLVYHFSL